MNLVKIYKRMSAIFLLIFCVVAMTACSNAEQKSKQTETTVADVKVTQTTESMAKDITLTIDGKAVPVSWEDNDTLQELKEQAKDQGITIQMSMYGGNEQVGSLGKSFTKNDKEITTQCGDIVLYNGNQIVIFYGSNTWAYTRLGKLDMSNNEVVSLLSNGNVTVELK